MSKQPRKQRKAIYNAPLHARNKFMCATLSKELREKTGKRTLALRVGDKVRVLRGDFKDHEGDVEKIIRRTNKVIVDGVTLTKHDANTVFLPIHPSNLMIIDAEFKDDKRNKNVGEN